MCCYHLYIFAYTCSYAKNLNWCDCRRGDARHTSNMPFEHRPTGCDISLLTIPSEKQDNVIKYAKTTDLCQLLYREFIFVAEDLRIVRYLKNPAFISDVQIFDVAVRTGRGGGLTCVVESTGPSEQDGTDKVRDGGHEKCYCVLVWLRCRGFRTTRVTSNGKMLDERWTGKDVEGRGHSVMAAFAWKGSGNLSNKSG